MGNFLGAQVRPGAVSATGMATATGTATGTVERGAITGTVQSRAAVIERGAVEAHMNVDASGVGAVIVCMTALILQVLRDVLLSPNSPLMLQYIANSHSLLPILSFCATAVTYRRLNVLQVANLHASQRMQMIADSTCQSGTSTSVPPGTVFAWKPSTPQYADDRLQVPDGYAVCDGTNDTPNLVGRFICGASTKHNASLFQMNSTGGHQNPEHKVSTTLEVRKAWTSGWNAKRHCYQNIGEDALQLNTLKEQCSWHATCEIEDHLPPYYTLVYIMKL